MQTYNESTHRFLSLYLLFVPFAVLILNGYIITCKYKKYF